MKLNRILYCALAGLHANGSWSKRVARGWQVSGITTFATGLLS